jgi:nucleotide-binding universal stress UspA family protein
MAKQTGSNPNRGAQRETGVPTPFCRMLVAIDESQAAEAAVGLVAEWVEGPGADVCLVQVREASSQRRSGAESDAEVTSHEPALRLVVSAPTLGARNRQLVHGIAEAAEAFGADIIVLGLDRTRLAGHRLATSLRGQMMRATDLPVLVAPTAQSHGKRGHRRMPDQRMPDLHRDEERADAPGYARV